MSSRFLSIVPILPIALVLACTAPGMVIGPDGQLVDADELDGSGSGTFDDDDDGDYPPGPLHPDTILVEEHPCFLYADVLTEDREQIELGFDCDASVIGLEPGKIVAGVQDDGYLRRIVDVEFDGYRAYLVTEFASLAEAVTDVYFEEDIQLEEGRGTIEFGNRTLDEHSEDGVTSSVVIDKGVLTMTPNINASADFGFLRLKSVTSRNRVNIDIEMDATFKTDGPVDRTQMVELTRTTHPFTLRVGPVRVHGRLESVIKIGFAHTSTGPMEASTSWDGDGTIAMGGTYTMPGSWSPYWNPTFEGTVQEIEPQGMGDWTGRVYLKIDSQVVLNGNPGGTSLYWLLSDGMVQADCDGLDWQAIAGIRGQTNMRLRFMGRSVDHDFPEMAIGAGNAEGTATHATTPEECLEGDDDDAVSDDDDDDDAVGDDDDVVADDDDTEDSFGVCTPVGDLACGMSVAGDTELDAAAVAGMDAYPCNVGNYDAPEMVYRWTATTGSEVEFALVGASPTDINHDLFVLDGGGGSCSAEYCVAHGFNSVTFEPVPGNIYYLVVDGFWDEAGAFEAVLNCN